MVLTVRSWLILVAFGGAAPVKPLMAQDPAVDWRSDWMIAPGLTISLDAEGFDMPTAIAFVPTPGSDPKDPLYFVTELRGSVKVVTNDRSVLTFSDRLIESRPDEELPSVLGETGMAGICLEPKAGFVFVTYAYEDAGGIYRNNIVRFHTRPTTFAVTPDSSVAFTDIFAAYISAVSHQIGPCQIKDDLLYVSVGDGERPYESRNLASLLGKIIRMTLDGNPVRDNPFYTDGEKTNAANYVYALGLRNPFSLTFAGERLFAADNGPTVDRFVEIRKGEDYLWDGTDWSIGTRADVVFAPSPGTVQMDYLRADDTVLPPQYRGNFLIATAGLSLIPGPGVRGAIGVIALPYQLEQARPAGPPETMLQYLGAGNQSVVGLALHDDGLYLATIFPVRGDQSAILRISTDPESGTSSRLIRTLNPVVLFHEKGCLGCHVLPGQGGGRVGPLLDSGPLTERLRTRLHTEAYTGAIARLDESDDEFLRSYRSARAEVLSAEGLERVRIWTRYRLLEPRFDNPAGQMPNLGLSEREAEILTDFLIEDVGGGGRLRRAIRGWIPTPRYRHIAGSFILGLVVGAGFWVLQGWLRRR